MAMSYTCPETLTPASASAGASVGLLSERAAS